MFLLKPDLDPASLRLAWHSRKQMPTASILFWITTGQLVRLHKEELDDFFLSVFLSFFLWCMTEEEYQWRVLRCYGKWGCARPRALPRAPDECAQRSLRPAQKKHVSLDARLTARTGALVRTTLDHLSWVVVVVGLGRGLATRRGQGAGAPSASQHNSGATQDDGGALHHLMITRSYICRLTWHIISQSGFYDVLFFGKIKWFNHVV